MKNISLVLAASLLSTPVFAGSTETITPMVASIAAPVANAFGGSVYAYYGISSGENGEGSYNGDETFPFYGVTGSIGKAGNGGFGWQLDANYAAANLSNGSYYANYSGTVHGNFGLGGMTAGAFVGGGVGNNIEESDAGSMYWYGLEAAKAFGNIALSAQVGLASSDNDHSSLNSSDMLFGGVEARYFVSDRFMITANLQAGTGIIHGDTLLQTQYGIEGMMQLGQSNFYGSLGYRGSYMNADINGGSEGQGGENAVMLGVTMLFGGGSLRDIYAGSTPMMTNELRTLVTVNTATYD